MSEGHLRTTMGMIEEIDCPEVAEQSASLDFKYCPYCGEKL